MKMIYLATPYTHKSYYGKLMSKFVMWRRCRAVTKVAAKVLAKGHNVFSPITHSHYISVIGNISQLDSGFWLGLDKWYVDRCDELWVYAQGKVCESIGVQWEIQWAIEQGKIIRLVDKYANEIT